MSRLAAAVVLALVSIAPPSARARQDDLWTTIWYVRISYPLEPQPCAVQGHVQLCQLWATVNVSSDDHENYSRAAADAKRDEILAHGWVMPNLLPGPDDPLLRGEERIVHLERCSTKRMLCRLDLPLPERPPCQYPDGDGPAAGAT